jgi:chaperonin GroEL
MIDPFEDMGAQLIKSAAQKTNDTAGDGTTTSIILAQYIAKKGFEYIAAGGNPMKLKREIDNTLKQIIINLKNMASPTKSDTEIQQIATISAGDEKIGKIVSEAVTKVGKEGVITVEEGNGMETVVEYKQGMEIERGYLSPYFVTDQSKLTADIENPYILITDKKLNHNYEIVPFIEKFLKESGSKNLVIIAGEIYDEALQTLALNTVRGAIKVVGIQAPSFGSRRVDELEDIAVLTGGRVVLLDSGRDLGNVSLTELGRAARVTVDRNKTIILDGMGDKEGIKTRMEEIKDQIKLSNSEFEADIRKERLAKLAGGVSIIKVGATTEVELRENKERVIDAKNATVAAIEEGIVAGGEITLFTLANDFFKLLRSSKTSVLTQGATILLEALKQPFIRLVENAGLDYTAVWAELSTKKYPVGIDVIDGEIKDLIKAGIIDPVKVTRCALENAVSIATMAMTTSVLISEPIEENERFK